MVKYISTKVAAFIHGVDIWETFDFNLIEVIEWAILKCRVEKRNRGIYSLFQMKPYFCSTIISRYGKKSSIFKINESVIDKGSLIKDSDFKYLYIIIQTILLLDSLKWIGNKFQKEEISFKQLRIILAKKYVCETSIFD